MSAAERMAEEAQRFLAGDLEYAVSLRSAQSYSFFYLSVDYQGSQIGEKTFHGPTQYWQARRWLRRTVRGHRKLLAAAAAEGARYE